MAGENRRTYDLMAHINNQAAFNQLPAKEKWRKLKSSVPKPLRPATGFTRFISDYLKKANKRAEPKVLMTEASNAWSSLSEEEKNVWKQSCAAELEGYRRTVEEYHQVRNSLKKPGSAFALYLKERWSAIKANPKTGRGARAGGKAGFKSINKKICSEWKKLSAKEKQKYIEEAKRLQALYVAERDAILSGARRQFNMNWNEEEDVEMAEE